MQQENFDTLSDKIQKEFEFDENSKDFAAFFKPFVVKVLLSIIFSTKISENTKIKVFNIISKSGKIRNYFLESLNEKELLFILNNAELSEILFENLDRKNKETLYQKLNKEIGIFPRVLLLDQIPVKLQKIIKECGPEQNQKIEISDAVVRQSYSDTNFEEAEKLKAAQIKATQVAQEENFSNINEKLQTVQTKTIQTIQQENLNNIKQLLNNINFSNEVAELLSQTSAQKDQFLIIANKENINLDQLKKMESLLSKEHDKRALLTNALLNPFIKNNMDTLKYIVQQAHDSSDFELWSSAMDELDTLKESTPEVEDDSFVARLKRNR